MNLKYKYLLYKVARLGPLHRGSYLGGFEKIPTIQEIHPIVKDDFLASQLNGMIQEANEENYSRIHLMAPLTNKLIYKILDYSEPKDTESIPRSSSDPYNLILGNQFFFGNRVFKNMLFTSEVIDIINNNLFTTKNSVYYIMDEATQIMLHRQEQLKNIL